jgi:hypothetical protein
MWTRGAPRCASVTSDQAHISISSRGTPEGWAAIPSEQRRRKATSATPGPPGHPHNLTEGDLIAGAHGKSAAATLVERTTRFTVILGLEHGKDSVALADTLIESVLDLPAMLRQSLTWDQGSEMARHAHLSLATTLPVYFAHPRSPWERGTNENTTSPSTNPPLDIEASTARIAATGRTILCIGLSVVCSGPRCHNAARPDQLTGVQPR